MTAHLQTNLKNPSYHDLLLKQGWQTSSLSNDADNRISDHCRAIILDVRYHQPALVPVMPDETWKSAWRTSFSCWEPVLLRVVEQLAAKDGGSVVLMMSPAMQVGISSMAHQATAQSVLWSYARTLARRFGAKNIRINALAIAYIQNSYLESAQQYIRDKHLREVPLGRFGTVEDVLNVLTFLLGDESAYITGQTLMLDGGASEVDPLCWRLLGDDEPYAGF